jgi:hypothetical protein
MELNNWLNRRQMLKTRALVAKLSHLKLMFTLSSTGYCAVHWLFVHNFSAYVFAGALVFGALVTTAVAWLSRWFNQHALGDMHD